jgi:VanZ family protein
MLLFVFIVSLYPIQESSTISIFNIPHADKIVHFLMYALLSFIMIFEQRKVMKKSIRITVLYVFILCFLTGSVLEFVQEYLIPGRDGNVFDIMANTVGILFGLTLLLLFSRKNSP